MHKEILSKNQVELLPLLKYYSKDYILVGGTAIALYLGHRGSIDFDLFTNKRIKRISIKNYLSQKQYKIYKLIKEEDQIHFILDNVKITFFHLPFQMNELISFNNIINIPDLLSLAAMKAFALGGRGKWKDYVDLYFLLKYHFSLSEIIGKAESMFGNSFNDKLFREQLAYFDDIDYMEKVVFRSAPVNDDEIKIFLSDTSLEKL